ncbi:serine/threonine protein kinase [Fischerella thermalis CCMEE 5330]|uniref:Serine/threonine protein kinase n=1 Tax=Fischerella thermalis CCMEE 5330 TaxID=2019670 RepID=A0A2N6MCC3_9CYAN|nr:serine/threonine-protein kinase [Fischerella thermalis]PMB44409.1 serine/threonine protein kinase [Fischerella thermalis CCMEE 5330]
MDQLVNQVLRDRYHIQSLLGRQTGRRTFLAKDLQTGSSVVIKLLLFSPDFNWDDLKLFEREVEVLQSLDHPAIPKYIDRFEVETELGKGFALVQTYIEARSLQNWIESGRTFSEAEIKAIAKQLLEILDYLHSRQPPVVHRDIKPSNILLGDRTGNSPGQIYLIDFGSVQTVVHSGTRTVVGTYGYMPPEQFGGRTVPASDLYALGTTLIYLVTGQHPDELPQREMRILFEDRVNLSPNLIDWLKWLTEPSLDLRLKSAKQTLEALEKSNLRASSLAIAKKPVGSKVKLTNTREMLEILIPPRGFHLGLIPIIGFAIAWNYFLVMWYGIAFSMWSSGGLFAALFAIFHLGVGFYLIWTILYTLFGQVKLRITPQEISLTRELLGVKCPPVLSAARQDIVKVELTRLSYKRDPEGGNVKVPPQINIWAGIKKFELGGGDRLTIPELDWLAHNLSSWLNLPITRD